MNQTQRISIVGAGTAGLASAIFMARQGFVVTLYERIATPQAVGAGILLQPSGMAVLEELNALNDCTQLGAPIKRLLGTSGCGKRVILDTRYDDWRVNSHGLGIHRATLLHALYPAAVQAGVNIVTGVSVARWAQTDAQVQLWAIDAQGNESLANECDALILADGTRSGLRAHMQVRQSAKPYPWGALWAIVPTPEGSDNMDLRQWYKGCREMFGIMPTGATHDAPAQKLSSLFWSLPVAQFADWQKNGLSAWKTQVLKLAGAQAQPFLDLITEPHQLKLAAYSDVTMKQYVDGRVLAIGDCAHAMSPQLGQGANMALVDAHVLNKCVVEVCKTGRVDWPEVFAQYSQTRQKHLKYYRQASRWLTPLFQSKLPLGFVRDSALLVARHTALGRMHAATTLVGGRVSWLRMNQSAVTLAHWDGGCAPEKNQ